MNDAASNNPWKMKVEGTIVNGENSPEELKKQLTIKTHLLEEATKLVARLQDEMRGARTRMSEQEAELHDLREELNKPTGA